MLYAWLTDIHLNFIDDVARQKFYQEIINTKCDQLLEKMQQLADADAMKLQNDLKQVVNQAPNKIIVLTHVPPFKETCLHKGEISGDDWLPYFSSKVMGDVLTTVAQQNPEIEFLVLCGHTHSEARYQPLVNLTVLVGRSDYGSPSTQEIGFT